MPEEKDIIAEHESKIKELFKQIEQLNNRLIKLEYKLFTKNAYDKTEELRRKLGLKDD